ncbi:MAG: site-specific recombinase [Methylotenera sp.]|uniref:site-specific recombinase n=1 Tax=Methylotenera sp. TaxID=2051956 RepID=UPI0024898562|nr:site-specific recombinase [Methylotenera sp.]MDI1308321.1 site-specific recombinase [Methylotenera sp.]
MIENVFERHINESVYSPQSTAKFIARLIAEIRPPKPHQVEAAIKAIQALCYLLNSHPEKASQLREAILRLLSEHKPISLFLVSRHSAFSGFFTEMRRRIGHKLLPEAVDETYLLDLFACFFTKTSDEIWVQAVPNEVWEKLIIAIGFDEPTNLVTQPIIESCRQNFLAATQVLSYRIAALGLEPELLRNHPELEQHTSPFIAQQIELAKFLASPEANTDELNSKSNDTDIKHILVMLNQCSEVVMKIRRNSAVIGTSIQLTFMLQGMAQQVTRLEMLLEILDHISINEKAIQQEVIDNVAGSNANLKIIKLFKELVYSECHKNDVSEHLRENMEVMALRVTENASRAGEHYITGNRKEYYALMRSAMGAGVIIAFMSMIKILLAKQHMAPLTEAILFSLNYGLGFILIHILHFTVATKQPAMTAAAIAASIDATDSKSKEMDNLVAMIANTMRSQIVAILGNVVLVIPIAILIGWGVLHFTGQHFITVEKANILIADIDPIRSGSLFYAAVAGICLFLSGLIAGYHDNLAIYNKIPQRLRAVAGLQKILGIARLNRVANYVENNLGALAGNFYFGCLLGGMTAIGVLFGLPFDIRHITFSSAYAGYSAVALDFMLSWQAVAYIALSLALIGFVNLAVSFSLALYVAMKSRKVRFKQWRLLLGNLATRLNQHPGEFIFPPKKSTDKITVNHE